MRKLYSLFAIICLTAFLFVVYDYYNKKNNTNYAKEQPKLYYTLIEVDNAVNLYYGNEFIKRYPSIVVSTLPLTDRDNLKSGMHFESFDEVTQIIEDFDGQ